MEHYVTLFDGAFLPQALALQESLASHGADHTLWMLCVDEQAFDALTRCALPNTRLLRLADVETPALRRVRPTRDYREYCWTLTPFAPRFVFEADASVERVTYLDADMYLLRSLRPVFAELEASGKAVLITEHAYAPEHDKSATNGRFCVQLVTFTRQGEAVRQWWEDQCIESCRAVSENGRFGDQKYLDEWPDRFGELVHVLEHQEWMLAPWNVTRFPYGSARVHHFHGLRLMPGGRVNLGEYVMPPVVVEHVYGPYLASLQRAIASLRSIGVEPPVQQRPRPLLKTITGALGGVYRQLWKVNRHHYRSI